jgi:hypothetical protein
LKTDLDKKLEKFLPSWMLRLYGLFNLFQLIKSLVFTFIKYSILLFIAFFIGIYSAANFCESQTVIHMFNTDYSCNLVKFKNHDN